jgi:hypothetical protein
LEAYAPVYKRAEIEAGRSGKNSNNRNIQNGNSMRLHGVQTIRNSLTAAAMRSRHSLAGALPLHLAAAGTLRSRHARIRQNTRHRWRNERQDKRDY